MIVVFPDKVQDTIKHYQPLSKDSARISNDSLPAADSVHMTGVTVCKRNSFTDVSFLDRQSFLRNLKIPSVDRSVIVLSEKTKSLNTEKKEILITKLKDGDNIQSTNLNHDWILLVLLTAGFLLTVVSASLKNLQQVTRFFLFRATKDQSADTGILFHWQTTLLNLMSFLVISLFVFQVAAILQFIPAGLDAFIFWAICLTVVIASLTLRHITCIVTGNLSGRSDVFNEYLVGVYQSYHFSALVLSVLVVLISYTTLLPDKVFMIAGISAFGVMYLIRVAKLLVIFMNRNISLLYLILYLCALEILPVAIAVRYLSGPVRIG